MFKPLHFRNMHQEAEDDIQSLQERLAAYNIESSGEKSQGKYFWAEVVKYVMNPPM